MRLTYRGYNDVPLLRTDAEQTEVIAKLAAYEDAEEQGLLVRLLCKVGDTLYRPFFNSKSVLEYKIIRVMLRDTEIRFTACHYEYNMKKYEELVYIWQIGKKFFLTREEAEAALKGLKGEIEDV